MPYRETPTTRRRRVVIVVVMWIFIGIPLMIGCWTWFGWWSLLFAASGIWLTSDYVKEGDMFGTVDAAVAQQIAVFKRPNEEDRH